AGLPRGGRLRLRPARLRGRRRRRAAVPRRRAAGGRVVAAAGRRAARRAGRRGRPERAPADRARAVRRRARYHGIPSSAADARRLTGLLGGTSVAPMSHVEETAHAVCPQCGEALAADRDWCPRGHYVGALSEGAAPQVVTQTPVAYESAPELLATFAG